MRNGASLPTCTHTVFIRGAVLVERQYASKVICSQFVGTPLSLRLNARVSESSTVILIVFFSEAAFANMATNRRPARRAAILQILIKPTPPKTAMHLPQTVFRITLEAGLADFGTLCSQGVFRTIAFRAGEGWSRRANLPAKVRVQPSRVCSCQCPLRTGVSVIQQDPSEPEFGPLG